MNCRQKVVICLSKTPGVQKKCKAKKKQHWYVGLHATKIFDITKGQEVWDMHSSPQYQLPHSCLCTGISQLRLALSL